MKLKFFQNSKNSDVGSVEGIAYDSLHRTIYFTSQSNPSINRVEVLENGQKGSPEIILNLNKFDKPRGIAVDPCEMLAFFPLQKETQAGTQLQLSCQELFKFAKI